jgi:phosphoribosyl-ATP pyrophosphohydrolase/phosphoribosyl-AMP cyclohydrolase
MTLTDRTIRDEIDLDRLRFAAPDGLMPVVTQDATTGAVLMVAYANREALRLSLETGEMHFWSRSRSELWRKGATSGNILVVRSLHADCDSDTVLAIVVPSGPACHTGERTCFGEVAPLETRSGTLQRLDGTLRARATERPANSYTVRLLDDVNLRLKKLGEEQAELVAALAVGDADRAAQETADLWYHCLVALRAEGVGLDAVLSALASREG